jgi:hypothetical protein
MKLCTLEIKYIKKHRGLHQRKRVRWKKGLHEIIELFKDSDLTKHLEKEKQREAMDNEMQQAEELRLQSLETIGETSRRRGSDKLHIWFCHKKRITTLQLSILELMVEDTQNS